MLAIVFPGQGSQFVGMGQALMHPAAREVFAAADQALGLALTKLCAEGPEVELQLTANSQPAILTMSIALWAILRAETDVRPDLVAGHSLGEYSALVAADAMDFADAVRLVRKRGQLMQEAVPAGVGGMAAVGATAEEAESLCRDAALGQVLEPANYNGERQIVIAGHSEAIARAVKLGKERKLAVKELKVSAPFHCSLMAQAAARFAPALKAVHLVDAKIPVVSNVDAQPHQRAEEIRKRLLRQVTAAVKWDQCMRTFERMGVMKVIELGPGKILTKMLSRFVPAGAAAPMVALSCEQQSDIAALKT